MQATSTNIRTQRWEAIQAETAAAAEVAAKLNGIERSGRCVNHFNLDNDVEAKGEKFLVTIMRDGNEIALTFTSYTRLTGRQVEDIIDGRTTHGAVSHTRRALVTAAGHVFVEVDGRLALTPNKYEKAAQEMLARLGALGLWRADRTAYTTPSTFAEAA